MTTTYADAMQTLPVLKAIRAHYGDEHIGAVSALIAMAPRAGQHTQRLPAAAYRKGLIAGLSYDSLDKNRPECPYDTLQRRSNFARGYNDPSEAWRDGVQDGLRIREIVLWPERQPEPGLQWREMKVLPLELQSAHVNRKAAP